MLQLQYFFSTISYPGICIWYLYFTWYKSGKGQNNVPIFYSTTMFYEEDDSIAIKY